MHETFFIHGIYFATFLFRLSRLQTGQKTLRLERFIQNLLIIKNKNKHGGWYALARLAGWVK